MRYGEIYRSAAEHGRGATFPPPPHRCAESPTAYSSAGCSPAEPASLGAMLRLGDGDCQHSCPPELRGQRPTSGRLLSDPERFELRGGFQTLQVTTLKRLIPDHLRNLPTNSAEEPVFYQQTGNVAENKASPKTNVGISLDVDENTVLI